MRSRLDLISQTCQGLKGFLEQWGMEGLSSPDVPFRRRRLAHSLLTIKYSFLMSLDLERGDGRGMFPSAELCPH